MKDNTSTLDRDAISLYRNKSYGILSTMSKIHKDYPFGSFVTYVSARSRTAYLYLSDLAEHTENLHYKSESSLTIFETNHEGDVQNSQRLTLVGDLSIVEEEDVQHCSKLFYSILPDSKKYSQMHDFKFYQLVIKSARWIGGFGKIAWLDEKSWSNENPEWYENEKAIIHHMNEDHQETIVSALKAQHNIEDKTVKMSLMNIDGYYVKSRHYYYFIQFPKPSYTSADVKKSLTILAKKYRKFEH
jgi:hypothetical protein|tara:strand:+ start:64 stop:795 length:732 start_codon:yes stop_codon:yes gene_type:complete